MKHSPDKMSGASAPRPTVRHSVARAELGECHCPKCSPELHVQPATEPAPPPPPADTAQEAPDTAPEPRKKRRPDKSVALDGAERIAVGGNPRPDDAEVARLREALRAAEARWLVAYGALHEAITTCRAQERAIASLQQDLRATVEGVYREKMLADEVPRLWIDRTRWASIVEAQHRAIALVSKMASAGPDWSASVGAERAALVEALAKLDAVESAGPSLADGAAPPRTSRPLTSGVSAAECTDGENR